MDKGKKGGRGNKGWSTGPNAGRPKLTPEERKRRKGHQVRAFDDEWDVIKRFITLTRKDLAACEKLVRFLEME